MSSGKKAQPWQINHVEKNAEHYSARQLAEQTGLSENWIYQHCNANAIKLLKVNKKGHLHKAAKPLPQFKKAIGFVPDLPPLCADEIYFLMWSVDCSFSLQMDSIIS